MVTGPAWENHPAQTIPSNKTQACLSRDRVKPASTLSLIHPGGGGVQGYLFWIVVWSLCFRKSEVEVHRFFPLALTGGAVSPQSFRSEDSFPKKLPKQRWDIGHSRTHCHSCDARFSRTATSILLWDLCWRYPEELEPNQVLYKWRLSHQGGSMIGVKHD